MKLVIDRSTWLRGDPEESCLLDRHGSKCCLGFFAVACGADEDAIFEIGDPCDSAETVPWPEWLLRAPDPDELQFPHNSAIADELIALNDRIGMLDAEREAGIVRIFAKHGVEVEFIDGGST